MFCLHPSSCLRFDAINVAMGNTRPSPYSFCLDAHAGLEADIIAWDMVRVVVFPMVTSEREFTMYADGGKKKKEKKTGPISRWFEASPIRRTRSKDIGGAFAGFVSHESYQIKVPKEYKVPKYVSICGGFQAVFFCVFLWGFFSSNRERASTHPITLTLTPALTQTRAPTRARLRHAFWKN